MTYETKHPIRVVTYLGGAAMATVLAVGYLGGEPAEGIAPSQSTTAEAPGMVRAENRLGTGEAPVTRIDVEAASCRIEVAVKQCNGRSCTIMSSWGSGTLIARQRVLTCSHLFDDGADWVTVYFAGKPFEAKLLKRDPKADLALLEVPEIVIEKPGCDHPHTVAVVPTGYTDAVSERGTYTYCGFGSGPFVRSAGPFVQWTESTNGYAPAFVIRGFGRDGDSGGGVFDGYGRLVGVRWGAWGESRDNPTEVYATGGSSLVEFLWGN